MFKFIGAIVVLAGIIALAGYSVGWFRFTAATGDNTVNVGASVDREEIRSDIKSTREAIVGKEK